MRRLSLYAAFAAAGLAVTACGSGATGPAGSAGSAGLTSVSLFCEGPFYHEATVTLKSSQAEIYTVRRDFGSGTSSVQTTSPAVALTSKATQDFRALLDSLDVMSWRLIPKASQLATPGIHCGVNLATGNDSVSVLSTGIPTSGWTTLYRAMSLLARDYVGPLITEDNASVASMTVKQLPAFADDITVTDRDELTSLVDYFNGLTRGPAYEAEALAGAAYTIDVSYLDGSTDQIALVGNKYVALNGGPAHDVPYDQASGFDAVIGAIRVAHYHGEFTGTIVTGAVTAVAAAASGATDSITCEVDGHSRTIDVSQARHIVDITGAGHLMVHEGDTVEVGLTSPSVADLVFITAHAG